VNCCKNLKDNDFIHILGIHTLNIDDCHSLSNSCFIHLSGIHTLIASNNAWLRSEEAFIHFKGERCKNLYEMILFDCENLGDDGFIHLQDSHIHTLDVQYTTITDAALIHLKGIQKLDISGTENITGAFLFHYQDSLHTLNAYNSNITDESLTHLVDSSCIYTIDLQMCPFITSLGLKSFIASRGGNVDDLDIRRQYYEH
jgi:hypothetical protein